MMVVVVVVDDDDDDTDSFTPSRPMEVAITAAAIIDIAAIQATNI